MPWVKEELKKVIRKYFEVNENKSTRYQDLWDTVKAVYWRKFTGLFWKKTEGLILIISDFTLRN